MAFLFDREKGFGVKGEKAMVRTQKCFRKGGKNGKGKT
jgi:hypothetical protein